MNLPMYQPDSHARFAQLQSRYPMSSLLTEFVQVHEGQVIVRAIVQVHGVTIATSLAAAPTVEQAEDQAQARVLALLGVGSINAPLPTASDPSPATNGFSSLPPLTPASWLEPELPVPPVTPAPTAIAPTYPPTFDELEAKHQDDSFSDDVDFVPEEFVGVEDSIATDDSLSSAARQEKPMSPIPSEFATPMPEMNGDQAGDRATPKPKKATEESTVALAEEPTPQPELPEPDDLSSLIALTDIEMDRIGWTKQEGREYLKRTYKKSTRQRLDVDELMDFLNYLRALPSLNGL